MSRTRGTRHRAFRALVLAAVCAVVGTLSVPTTQSSSASSSAPVSPLVLTRAASSRVIYLLGSVTCSRTACLRLYRTDDDGAHFQPVSLPPVQRVAGQPTGSIAEILFATPEVGYILEGLGHDSTLYATFDGARTWHQRYATHDVSLEALAATTESLYAVTYRCAPQPNGNVGCTHYQLVRSSLGARRWTGTPIPHGRDYPWGFLGNIAADAHHVWLTEGAKWSLLVTSSDDGRTFHTRSVGRLISVAGCDLTATGGGSLWAQCPTGMQARFSYSPDAGVTWNAVPADQYFPTGGGYFDPASSDLAYLDYGNATGRLNLFRVTDSGRRLIGVSHLSCPSLSSLVFTDRADGLALCSYYTHNELLRTSNGGLSWRRMSAT